MQIFYNEADNNQVQAIFTDNTASEVWDAFTKVAVTDAELIALLLDNGRDCRVTIVAGEVTAVTPFAYPVSLAVYKTNRYPAIDRRTRELIAVGFAYDGETFSLSSQAQSKWHGLYNASSDLTFPVKVTTVDNNEYSIPDGPTGKAMYLTGINTVKTHLDSGRTLKKSIYDAADKAAVDAVIDNR